MINFNAESYFFIRRSETLDYPEELEKGGWNEAKNRIYRRSDLRLHYCCVCGSFDNS